MPDEKTEQPQQPEQPQPISQTAAESGVFARDPFLQPARGYKPWDELDLQDKVERLRECLRMQRDMTDGIRRDFWALSAHSHGDNGQLLVPFGHTLGLAQAMSPGQGGSYGGPYDPLA